MSSFSQSVNMSSHLLSTKPFAKIPSQKPPKQPPLPSRTPLIRAAKPPRTLDFLMDRLLTSFPWFDGIRARAQPPEPDTGTSAGRNPRRRPPNVCFLIDRAKDERVLKKIADALAEPTQGESRSPGDQQAP